MTNSWSDNEQYNSKSTKQSHHWTWTCHPVSISWKADGLQKHTWLSRTWKGGPDSLGSSWKSLMSYLQEEEHLPPDGWMIAWSRTASSLADKALLQLDIPSFEMLIFSFTKDSAVLAFQLYVDWRLNRHSLSAPAWSSADQSGHGLALKNILSFLSSLSKDGVGNLLAPCSPGPSPVLLTPGLSGRGPGRILSCHRIVQKPGSSGCWERFTQDWEAAHSLPAGARPGLCRGMSPHSPAIEHVGPPSLPQGPDYKYGAGGCGARRIQGWWTVCTGPAPWGWRLKGSPTSTRTERRRACGSSTLGTPAAVRLSTRLGCLGCCTNTAARGYSTWPAAPGEPRRRTESRGSGAG